MVYNLQLKIILIRNGFTIEAIFTAFLIQQIITRPFLFGNLFQHIDECVNFIFAIVNSKTGSHRAGDIGAVTTQHSIFNPQ